MSDRLRSAGVIAPRFDAGRLADVAELTRLAEQGADAPHGLVVVGAAVGDVSFVDAVVHRSTSTSGSASGSYSSSRGGLRWFPVDVGRPATAIVELADGTGAVVPLLPGQPTTVVVAYGKVALVGIGAGVGPSPSLDRAFACVLAAGGALDPSVTLFELDRAAPLDPTLAILAAHAHDRAGDQDKVDAIAAELLHRGLALLDVLPLTSSAPPPAPPHPPLWPMTTRGWTQLTDAAEIRRHLVPALFTTLRPEGVRLLRTRAARARP